MPVPGPCVVRSTRRICPSMVAMKRMGANFKEFNSNSTIMIVVEGQQPLGPDAHTYYDEIIRKLRQDPKHI